MATMTSVPQASSEELYGVNLSEAEIQRELQKWREQGKPLRIAVVGDTGTGISSLINSLVGRKVAEEGETLHTCTQVVGSYTAIINGVKVTIWDTPGLRYRRSDRNEVIVRKIRDTCKEVDVLIYCTELTNKRLSEETITTISVITKVFGKKVWDNAVIALTFANELHTPRYSADSEEELTFFKRRLQMRREDLCRVLKDDHKIEQTSIDHLPIVPTGYREPWPALPDRPDWKATFWTATFWTACCYQTKRYKTNELNRRARDIQEKEKAEWKELQERAQHAEQHASKLKEENQKLKKENEVMLEHKQKQIDWERRAREEQEKKQKKIVKKEKAEWEQKEKELQ